MTSWGNLLSLDTHRERRRKRWGGGGGGEGEEFQETGGRSPASWIPAVGCCGNLKQPAAGKAIGYVTFRGTAGTEGDRSSARGPDKRLNYFHNVVKECQGVEEWRKRER